MKKPWESQRVWFVILGVMLICFLEVIGKNSGISATHITGLVVALLYGRAQEKINGSGKTRTPNDEGPKDP